MSNKYLIRGNCNAYKKQSFGSNHKNPLAKNLTPAEAAVLLKTFISTTPSGAAIFKFSTKKFIQSN